MKRKLKRTVKRIFDDANLDCIPTTFTEIFAVAAYMFINLLMIFSTTIAFLTAPVWIIPYLCVRYKNEPDPMGLAEFIEKATTGLKDLSFKFENIDSKGEQ